MTPLAVENSVGKPAAPPRRGAQCRCGKESVANSHPPICPCSVPLAGPGGDFSFFVLILYSTHYANIHPPTRNSQQSKSACGHSIGMGERHWRLERRDGGRGMAPEVGLEPTTTRLTAACSTIELLWIPNGRAIYKHHVVPSNAFTGRLRFDVCRTVPKCSAVAVAVNVGWNSRIPETQSSCR